MMIEGLPFSRWFTGDIFADGDIPFHSCENCFVGGTPPSPTDEVEVAVVGGGLSGLCSAYLLRDRDVALFELRDRCGGNTMGERWHGVTCSLGGAYFIVPDRGSYLDGLYRELGVWPGAAVDKGSFEVEVDGVIVDDFLKQRGLPPDEQAIYRRYASLVAYYADEAYPEIPLPTRGDVQWILDLDNKTLREDIEQKIGGPLPQLLAAAVQAYCYSSFGAGWDEISAAAGWNFLAAEEFGRVVLPGGNVSLAEAFWRGLQHPPLGGASSTTMAGRTPRTIVQANSKVVDVRLSGDRVQVTYARNGAFRSLLAEHVVMANSKHVAKWMIHDLPALDREKFDAMQQVSTAAYVVVNVLLAEPVPKPFYDIFLLGDGNFPMDPTAAENHSAVVDVLNGEFGVDNGEPTTVLTLYWPLPWPSARFTLIDEDAWRNYAQRLAPQVKHILDVLGVSHAAVRQVRMSRWGHAMPIPKPGAIAFGTIEKLRRPLADRIWFVNQDNWMLPAVENSLLEAKTWTDEIGRRLRT